MEQTTGRTEDLPQAVPTPRAEAVARYGSHWKILWGEPAARELLGEADPDIDDQYPTLEALLEGERKKRREKAEHEKARIEGILSHRRSRLLMWLARWRLHRHSRRILEKVAGLRGRLEEQREILATVDAWEPALERLPEQIMLPAFIAPGRSVWRVNFTWPLTEGIRLFEGRVEAPSLLPRSGFAPEGSWDYRIRYRYRDEGGDGSFTYDLAEETDPELRGTGRYGERLFLTRESAERCVRETAALLRAKADEAVAAL